MEENKKSSIEKTESELYSPSFVSKEKNRGMMSGVDNALPHSWDGLKEKEGDMSKKSNVRKSMYRKVFVSSVVFFFVAVVFAVGSAFLGGSSISSGRIDINVLGNTFTEGGEPLPLTVEVVNRNRGPITLVDLSVEYPKGSSPDSEKVRYKTSLGDIGAGSKTEEDIEVVLFGEQNGIQNIVFTLEYKIASSNSIFKKEVVYPVTIARSPISIFVDGPTDTSSNQEITLSIKIKQDASQDSGPLGVTVSYPPGFQFEEATPAPVQGQDVFNIGEISAGGEKEILIKGKMFGEEGDERSFRIYTGEFSSDNATALGVVLSSYIHTISIRRPFLEASLVYNDAGGDTYIVEGGKELEAEIRWANNLPDRIDNAEIILDFSGSAYDPTKVSATKGFWRQEQNQLVFTKSSVSDFASIAPGEEGTLKFKFTPKTTNASGQIVQNPNVTISVSIKGDQVLSGSNQNTVSTLEQKTFKISSLYKVSGRVLQRSGNITNSGPLPPNSSSPTTYTIVWSVTNSTNVLSDGTVRATLPSYVDWTGATFPATENISYNSVTREVVWRLGNIAPSVGYNSPVREASFQVRLNTSASQAGTSPVLVDVSSASGRDEYTGVMLESNWTSLNTRLGSDPLTSSSEWVVAY
ncbi:hypothetical protein H6790_03055 [Candidatus Nomurabacteria bacterium]|nr:hypothetical protein [Candidatus Nomurabacteria bacterium]MCB9820897.1 hypothetical protein [Candidatus Nomurabacteria bacterium]